MQLYLELLSEGEDELIYDHLINLLEFLFYNKCFERIYFD